MPRQRRLFGRQINLSALPRRFVFAFGFALLVTIVIVSATLSSRKTVSKLSKAAQRTDGIAFPTTRLPGLWNPFGEAVHVPPEEQKNSASGETKWHSALNWLQHPFSSTVTLDEDRVLLPPLPARPPIYTYYETNQTDRAAAQAEHKLLLTWRRAWWAQGFRPTVLGRAEAKKHALHDKLPAWGLGDAVTRDIERWMAWSHMGGGILSNWLVLPMGPRDDPTLAELRAGRFSKLTAYTGLQGAILAGDREAVNGALQHAVAHSDLAKVTTVFATLPLRLFNKVARHDGLAYYDLPTITATYTMVAEQLEKSQAAGLSLLQQLINAHLHATWHAAHPGGIAVLQPVADAMRPLVAGADRLAHAIAGCPEAPVASCPPNAPGCQPCKGPLQVSTPASYRNDSAFTVGAVPHPYTFASLYHSKAELSAEFVRRHTPRDPWLQAVTRDWLGPRLGGPQRLPAFKAAVAGEGAAARGAWVTAEAELDSADGLDASWVFGFQLPGQGPAHKGQDEPQSSLQKRAAVPPAGDTDPHALLARAKAMLAGPPAAGTGRALRLLEAWNLADTEAWRFVRAVNARQNAERHAYEAGEGAFAGADRAGRDAAWGAWLHG